MSAFFFPFYIVSEAIYKNERWINMADEILRQNEMMCFYHI